MDIDGMLISPGLETLISMTPVKFSTTETVLQRLDPEERSCYKGTEVDLKYVNEYYGFTYGTKNCMSNYALYQVAYCSKCIVK